MTDSAPPPLRRILHDLRDRMRGDVEQVVDLRVVGARRTEIDDLLADLDRQLERIDAAAVITLVGATGAGKSTLLNALVGRTIAAEGVDRPTTRRPTIYAPPDADLSGLLAAVAKAAPAAAGDSAPHVVRHRSPGPWARHVLVDAPDLNSVDRSHRAVVTALVELSDVLVVVLHHQSVVEAAGVSFLDAFAERRRLVFVLNRSDELTPEARDTLIGQVKTLAAERLAAPDAPVVAVSARTATATPAAPEWLAFRTILTRLTRKPAMLAARRLNALGSADRLARLFDTIRDAVAPDMAALPEDVANGLGTLARRTGDDIAARIDQRRHDLTTALCFEAARRWEGPGGWALRTGGAATLGLGAAGLMLRRHPLTAAGAALGTLAADRIDNLRRAARTADAGPLPPAPADLADWYADALAPARLRAARLAGTPDAFGLPSVAALRGRIADTVDHAWSRLVEIELPAAAAYGAVRVARWPLDGPVYAFAAWMLYRVGAAFVAGTYVGVDFLLNAALLLGAYLLAVRTAVRAGLDRRAQRLSGHVVGRVRTALEAEAERAHTATRGQLDGVRAALDRLCTLPDLWRHELSAR